MEHSIKAAMSIFPALDLRVVVVCFLKDVFKRILVIFKSLPEITV